MSKNDEIQAVIGEGYLGGSFPCDEQKHKISYTDANNEKIEISYRVYLGGQSYSFPLPRSQTPIFIISGWTQVQEDWDPFASRLSHAQRVPVVVFDNRGIGESTLPQNQWVLEDMATDLTQLMDKLGFSSADLIGLSMGGFIIQQFLVNHRWRARKIIFLATAFPHLHTSPELKEAMKLDLKLTEKQSARKASKVNFAPGWPEKNPEQFERYVEKYLRFNRPPMGVMMQFRALQNWLFEEAIKPKEELKWVPFLIQPVLFVHGQQDWLIPPHFAQESAQFLKKRRWSVIVQNSVHFFLLQDAGHDLIETHSDQVLDIISQFLPENKFSKL